MQSSTLATTDSTVIEALVRSLEIAARYNPNDVVHPHVVLWTDHDSQWRPIIPQLRRLAPQLLTIGDYEPENRTGPAIWLRCVLDGALDDPKLPEEKTPIVYLPDISRQELRAVQECPDQPQAAGGTSVPGGLLDPEEWQGLDRRGLPGC